MKKRIFLVVIGTLLVLGAFFVWWFRSRIYLPAINQPVNVLVLGKGGVGHEAPDLTDTMILISFPVNGEIKLVSLSRDLWVADNRAKLNASYYWGQEKGVGGLVMAKSDVIKITGLKVDYGVVLDFSVFEKVVDTLGGISVVVENSFVDTKYPIAGRENDLCNGDRTYACRYETVSFDQGLVHMDGSLALKFVRSRNAVGDEGTDLARGRRQTQLISAIKNKLLSKEVVLSPSIWKKLMTVVQNNLETDMTPRRMFDLGLKIIHLRGQIASLFIPDGYLINPPVSLKYDRQYVFVPKNGSWMELQTWFKEVGF